MYIRIEKGKVLNRIEYFLKENNIYNCFEMYCQGEKLEGENGWYDEKTNKKIDVEKKIVFWSLPNILVIDLKRFTPSGKKIQVPLNLELFYPSPTNH